MGRVIDGRATAFAALCNTEMAKCQDVIDRYKAEIGDDPSRALESCDDLLEAAAEIGVWRLVRDALLNQSGKATIESVRDHAQRQVFVHAGNIKRSSSTTSMLAHRATGAAWADVIDRMMWEGVDGAKPWDGGRP